MLHLILLKVLVNKDDSDLIRYIFLGKTYPLDICSVLHQNKRYYIFLSLTWAIIADIDKDSEKFRYYSFFLK